MPDGLSPEPPYAPGDYRQIRNLRHSARIRLHHIVADAHDLPGLARSRCGEAQAFDIPAADPNGPTWQFVTWQPG
jgi:hypothetical protein